LPPHLTEIRIIGPAVGDGQSWLRLGAWSGHLEIIETQKIELLLPFLPNRRPLAIRRNSFTMFVANEISGREIITAMQPALARRTA
jgi:hypothetical protein